MEGLPVTRKIKATELSFALIGEALRKAMQSGEELGEGIFLPNKSDQLNFFVLPQKKGLTWELSRGGAKPTTRLNGRLEFKEKDVKLIRFATPRASLTAKKERRGWSLEHTLNPKELGMYWSHEEE